MGGEGGWARVGEPNTEYYEVRLIETEVFIWDITSGDSPSKPAWVKEN